MSREATVAAHVAAFGQPDAITLDDETHVFHFAHGRDWRESPILFVNRNGNQFRLIEETDGRWALLKTWNTIWDGADTWQDPKLRRDTPMEVLKLSGIGPQGKDTFEALSLLPKGTTSGRRRAAYRGHLLQVGFDVDANQFHVTALIDGLPKASPRFNGKLWESKEAAAWCKLNLPVNEQVGTGLVAPTGISAVIQDASEKELAVLENSEVWGMFG